MCCIQPLFIRRLCATTWKPAPKSCWGPTKIVLWSVELFTCFIIHIFYVTKGNNDENNSYFQSDLMEDSALNSKYNALSKNKSHNRYGLNQLDLASSAQSESGVQTTGLSFSNPVYELSNPSAGESALDTLAHLPDTIVPTTSTPPVSEPLPNVAFKVEHVLAPSCSVGNRRFGSIRSGLDSRWRVAQAIYPYMVCIAMAYCVTLSLYPGIEAEIISCNLKSWMPVLLMFMFNTSDVIGKVYFEFVFA